jgi:hypothetical protein
VPWNPELFSAPALERVSARHRRDRLTLVPFYLAVMTGEIDAIVGSFAAEPEVHHPVDGRVKGVAAFERFAAKTNAWLADREAVVEDVGFIVTPRRRVEEVVLHLDGGGGSLALPVAAAAEHDEDGGLTEIRIYFDTWPLTGVRAIRPPLLQPDPDLHVDEVVGGRTGLEHCAVTEDGRACAIEYNVVGRGPAALLRQAGLAVYPRDDSGRLGAARIYDDAHPPGERGV